MTLSSNTVNQRARLLDELSRRAVSTFEAREVLDIPHPAARVKELRALGHNICTYRRTVQTHKGKHVAVAHYVLSGA